HVGARDLARDPHRLGVQLERDPDELAFAGTGGADQPCAGRRQVANRERCAFAGASVERRRAHRAHPRALAAIGWHLSHASTISRSHRKIAGVCKPLTFAGWYAHTTRTRRALSRGVHPRRARTLRDHPDIAAALRGCRWSARCTRLRRVQNRWPRRAARTES